MARHTPLFMAFDCILSCNFVIFAAQNLTFIHMRIYHLVLSLTLLLSQHIHNASAQAKWNQTYQDYIDRYSEMAIEQMLRHNIPASITLSQGLIESAAGRSALTRRSNNHFGIKCHSSWRGKRTYHDDDAAGECFRVYDNVRDSYEDHSLFLVKQPRYSRLFSLSRTDYKGWARGLKSCGYATDPQYPNKLIQIIELYNLNKLDHAKSYNHYLAHLSGKGGYPDNNPHVVKAYNDNYYIIARAGDTFKTLAQETGVSARKLAKYNERPSKYAPIAAGDIIYLKKKRSRCAKDYRHKPHTIKPGESMYTISQMYGVTLKSLYKHNRLDPAAYQAKPGDVLWLY